MKSKGRSSEISFKPSRDGHQRSELFRTIPRTISLVERSKEQLESLILSGSLPPGERLPTEHDLGEMLGVSRTVIRETIRLLTAKGLIEVTSGSGTFVRAIGPSILCDSVSLLLRANNLSPDQIYEVRSVLEVNAAGIAAERAGREEIASLEDEISILQRENLQAADYAKHDYLFHTRLAEATGNPLFLALINSISTVTIRTMSQMYAGACHESKNRRVRTEEHSAIVERIKQHDAEGARQAMADHMAGSLSRLREARRLSAIAQADFSPENDATESESAPDQSQG
jgi:GntR family transcriptional regulator, transcriptional repressor for pyruvate dehydrogenase complex